MDFKRGFTPNAFNSFSDLLKDVISEWNLAGSPKTITIVIVSDTAAELNRLKIHLDSSSGRTFGYIDDFNVKCLAHVINLVVNDCMTGVHWEIGSAWKVVREMQSSVKRRDHLKTVRKELSVSCELPILNTETRWSSTFICIALEFKIRPVLNAMSNKSDELADFKISEIE